MKMIKKMLGAVLAVAMLVSLCISAGAYNTPISGHGDFDIRDRDIIAPRYYFPDISDWWDYNEADIPGGIWYGGNYDNGGWGTLRSHAESTSHQTRVYVKPGILSANLWSAWAAAGQDSDASADAVMSGNKCGYDYKK